MPAVSICAPACVVAYPLTIATVLRIHNASNLFLVSVSVNVMSHWSFITNHARVLLFIANRPDARLRDLALALGITERTAYAIVADLAEGGYIIKERGGRRNRYLIQEDLPMPEAVGQKRTIGEVLELLAVREESADEPNHPRPSKSM